MLLSRVRSWQGNCHEDGQGTVRYNLNEVADLTSEMDRTTVYAYLNHEMENGVEFFADGYYYRSTTERLLYPTTALTASKLRVGAENPYNPLGPCLLPDGSPNPNRLPDSIIGTDVPCEGYELRMDFYRFAETPRSRQQRWRFLPLAGRIQGLSRRLGLGNGVRDLAGDTRRDHQQPLVQHPDYRSIVRSYSGCLQPV